MIARILWGDCSLLLLLHMRRMDTPDDDAGYYVPLQFFSKFDH